MSGAARVGRAIGGAWLLLGLEFLAVASFAHAQFASVWELQFGLIWLAPAALVVAALAGLCAVPLGWLLERAERRQARAALSALVGLLGGAFGFSLGGGRHLSELGTRLTFAGSLGLVCALFCWLCAAPMARAGRARPARLVLCGAGLVLGLELANRSLFVRLYPGFHWGLALAALTLAGLLAQLPRPGAARRKRFGPALVLAVCALSVLAQRQAAERLSHFDNFRLQMAERAPLLGKAVELAARLAPPAAWDEVSCDGLGEAERATTPSCRPASAPGHRDLDLRGRDFLLISIDALRADHVGAYGYERPTTPHLDELARSGVVFDAAYAATPHTSYSVTSLMTGKYMRPLLLQGAGQDSDTWASLFRTYSYHTAAFYPPAVFFIDPERFQHFKSTGLGFEYRWVEFAEGEKRLQQVRAYLSGQNDDSRLFLWVHLFGPHEPYEAHDEFPFGERDIDRYDSEIRAADETLGALVAIFRKRRPGAVVIATADHGEEFGEHGGHYHGSSVYEEQVRVPLVVSAPGVLPERRISEPVQTIDLLPTVLAALDIPRPPRIRGRDLGALLSGRASSGQGMALAETDEQTLLAEGSMRLICARKLGACQLFDLRGDPGETHDLSADRPELFESMRQRLHELAASHGRYEQSGLRAEGKGWPPAMLRGISGDGDAAEEIASLLDDADLAIRRKAAELLFDLKRPEAKPALRLAIQRDEDPSVRRYAALALTRLGEGAPLTFELAESSDLGLRRLAALALAENGDARGEKTLIAWWQDAAARDFGRSREIIAALGAIRSKDAIWPLTQGLEDVRLRPYLAESLARIGGDAARAALLQAFRDEPLQSTRRTLLHALVDLGAGTALAPALTRFLGVPDPIPNGIEEAERAKILEYVGGPDNAELGRLRAESGLGVLVTLTIPSGGNGHGVRAFFRGRCLGSEPGELVLSAADPNTWDGKRARRLPDLDPRRALRVRIPNSREPVVVYADVPPSVGARPGLRSKYVVFADSSVTLDAVLLVPLADELPRPPPKPWHKDG